MVPGLVIPPATDGDDVFVRVDRTGLDDETPTPVMTMLRNSYAQLLAAGHTDFETIQELMSRATNPTEILLVTTFVQNIGATNITLR